MTEENFLAEQFKANRSHLKGVAPPAWTGRVDPLEAPWFATSLKTVRLHLLRSAPVAFRRRNLFVDSSVGARV